MPLTDFNKKEQDVPYSPTAALLRLGMVGAAGYLAYKGLTHKGPVMASNSSFSGINIKQGYETVEGVGSKFYERYGSDPKTMRTIFDKIKKTSIYKDDILEEAKMGSAAGMEEILSTRPALHKPLMNYVKDASPGFKFSDTLSSVTMRSNHSVTSIAEKHISAIPTLKKHLGDLLTEEEYAGMESLATQMQDVAAGQYPIRKGMSPQTYYQIHKKGGRVHKVSIMNSNSSIGPLNIPIPTEGQAFVSDVSNTAYIARKYYNPKTGKVESLAGGTITAMQEAWGGIAEGSIRPEDITHKMVENAIYDPEQRYADDPFMQQSRAKTAVAVDYTAKGPKFKNISLAEASIPAGYTVTGKGSTLMESNAMEALYPWVPAGQKPGQTGGYAPLKVSNKFKVKFATLKSNQASNRLISYQSAAVDLGDWGRTVESGLFGGGVRKIMSDERLVSNELFDTTLQGKIEDYKIYDEMSQDLDDIMKHVYEQSGGMKSNKMKYGEWLTTTKPGEYLAKNPYRLPKPIELGGNRFGVIKTHVNDPRSEFLTGLSMGMSGESKTMSVSTTQYHNITEGFKTMGDKAMSSRVNQADLTAAARTTLAMQGMSDVEKSMFMDILKEQAGPIGREQYKTNMANFLNTGLVADITGKENLNAVERQILEMAERNQADLAGQEISGIIPAQDAMKFMKGDIREIDPNKIEQTLGHLSTEAYKRASVDPEYAAQIEELGWKLDKDQLVYQRAQRDPYLMAEELQKTGLQTDSRLVNIVASSGTSRYSHGYGNKATVSSPVFQNLEWQTGALDNDIAADIMSRIDYTQGETAGIMRDIADTMVRNPEVPSISLAEFAKNPEAYMHPTDVLSRKRVYIEMPGHGSSPLVIPTTLMGGQTGKYVTEELKGIDTKIDRSIMNIAALHTAGASEEEILEAAAKHKDILKDVFNIANKAEKTVGGPVKGSASMYIKSPDIDMNLLDQLAAKAERDAALSAELTGTFGEDFVKILKNKETRMHLAEMSDEMATQVFGSADIHAGAMYGSKFPNYTGSSQPLMGYRRSSLISFTDIHTSRKVTAPESRWGFGLHENMQNTFFFDADEDPVSGVRMATKESKAAAMRMMEDPYYQKMRKFAEASQKLAKGRGAAIGEPIFDEATGAYSPEFLKRRAAELKTAYQDIAPLHESMEILRGYARSVGGEDAEKISLGTRMIQERFIKTKSHGKSFEELTKATRQMQETLGSAYPGKPGMPPQGILHTDAQGAIDNFLTATKNLLSIKAGEPGEEFYNEFITVMEKDKGAFFGGLKDYSTKYMKLRRAETFDGIREMLKEPMNRPTTQYLRSLMGEEAFKPGTGERIASGISEAVKSASSKVNKKLAIGLAIGAVALTAMSIGRREELEAPNPDNNPVMQKPPLMSQPKQPIQARVMSNNATSMNITGKIRQSKIGGFIQSMQGGLSNLRVHDNSKKINPEEITEMVNESKRNSWNKRRN